MFRMTNYPNPLNRKTYVCSPDLDVKEIMSEYATRMKDAKHNEILKYEYYGALSLLTFLNKMKMISEEETREAENIIADAHDEYYRKTRS